MTQLTLHIKAKLADSPAKVFLGILVIFFSIEVAIMFLMPLLCPLEDRVLANMVDAMLLTTLAAPFLWHLIVSPIRDVATATHVKAEAILENVADCVLVFGAEGAVDSGNRALCQRFGYKMDELAALTIFDFIASEDYEKMAVPIRHVTGGIRDSISGVECRAVTKDGLDFPVEISISRVDDSGGRSFLVILRDMTEKKKAEEELIYLATHDCLTGLPNRTLFQSLLQEEIDRSLRLNTDGAVVFLDLDNLKFVNDTLGHDAGDALLRTLAGRLKDCIAEGDVLARIGGDEFTFILLNKPNTDTIAGVTERILAAIKEPVMIHGTGLYSTGSIGVSRFPQDGTSAESLLRDADIAMYNAKKKGKNRVLFFSAEMEDEISAAMALESRLRQALAENEFVMAYQPRVAAATGEVVGMEALIRWLHPDHGMVLPGTFIPLAEETGLIVQIGEWVMREAVRQGAEWHRRGLDFILSVNISAKQLALPDFGEDILSIVAAEGFPPHALELELTESMAMENMDLVNEFLTTVKKAGIKVAIDDFGTGYSSLSCLTKLPIDTIKLDREFVMKLPDSGDDATIAKTVITMGKCLDFRIVAEGVETHDQAMFLESHGCDELQGFFFGRPVTADIFEAMHIGAAVKHNDPAIFLSKVPHSISAKKPAEEAGF